MEKYDYYKEVREDVLDYIKERLDYGPELKEMDFDELQDMMYDDMWTADTVTGNGSGSYFFSTWKSEEALCHNLDLYNEACEDFGIVEEGGNLDAEKMDVTIRCYLYPQFIGECLKEALGQ